MRRVRVHRAILEPDLQRQIGKQLCAMYDEIMEEVPRHHRELLRQFDIPQQTPTPQQAPSPQKASRG
jgi:hypothetical protein